MFFPYFNLLQVAWMYTLNPPQSTHEVPLIDDLSASSYSVGTLAGHFADLACLETLLAKYLAISDWSVVTRCFIFHQTEKMIPNDLPNFSPFFGLKLKDMVQLDVLSIEKVRIGPRMSIWCLPCAALWRLSFLCLGRLLYRRVSWDQLNESKGRGQRLVIRSASRMLKGTFWYIL